MDICSGIKHKNTKAQKCYEQRIRMISRTQKWQTCRYVCYHTYDDMIKASRWKLILQVIFKVLQYVFSKQEDETSGSSVHDWNRPVNPESSTHNFVNCRLFLQDLRPISEL